MKYGLLGGLCTALFCGTAAWAAQIDVSPEDDVQQKLGTLTAGDVLVLKAGKHKGTLQISDLHGTAEKPIIIRGQDAAQIVPTDRDGVIFWPKPSSHVIVEALLIENARRAGVIVSGGRHITVRNCRIGNNGVWGVQTVLSDYITVENCELYGSKREHGIYFSTTDHPVARNNRIHDNAGCGIHNNGDKSEGGDGMISHGLFENNIIYNCGRRGGAAINMDSAEHCVVRNNLIYNCLAGGIVSFHGDGARAGDGNRFLHNTIWFAAGTGRYALQLSGGGSKNVVCNNILVSGRGPALEIGKDSDTALTSNYNVLWHSGGRNPVDLAGKAMSLAQWQQASGQDAKSVCADPLLLDPTGGKLALKPSSPAANMAPVRADAPADALGRRRPASRPSSAGALQ
jgi:hypothetical protein